MIFTLQGKYNISNLYFAVFTSFFCLLSVNADAKTYTFNSSMLNVDQRNTDLSVFESNSQLPGVYHVDIVLNGKLIEGIWSSIMHMMRTEGLFLPVA